MKSNLRCYATQIQCLFSCSGLWCIQYYAKTITYQVWDYFRVKLCSWTTLLQLLAVRSNTPNVTLRKPDKHKHSLPASHFINVPEHHKTKITSIHTNITCMADHLCQKLVLNMAPNLCQSIKFRGSISHQLCSHHRDHSHGRPSPMRSLTSFTQKIANHTQEYGWDRTVAHRRTPSGQRLRYSLYLSKVHIQLHMLKIKHLEAIPSTNTLSLFYMSY